MSLAITLAGGAWIFLGFIVFMLVAIVYGAYTRSGSGIAQRPYAQRYGDAPGAKGSSSISGRDGIASLTSRGTR